MPYQQGTETPGGESTIQLKKKKRSSEAGSQVIRLGGSHPHRDKQNGDSLRVESFTARTAEPKMVQLGGGGVSAITEAFHLYRGTFPLLTQPAIAEATRHNREQQGRADDCGVEPTAAGQSPRDRKSTRLNSSHIQKSRMPSSA